jgi:hypothetical protein
VIADVLSARRVRPGLPVRIVTNGTTAASRAFGDGSSSRTSA